MPVTIEDLERQRQTVKDVSTKAAQSAGFGEQFTSLVKQELQNRAVNRGTTQLTEMGAQARKEFATAPSDLREHTQFVDPMQRISLENQRKGTALAEMSRVADLKQRRQGTIEGIIEGLAEMVKAQAAREMAMAGVEQTDFGNLSSIFGTQQDIEQTAFERRMAEEQLAMERARLAASAAKENKPTERDIVFSRLMGDVNKGIPIEASINRYGDVLTFDDILQAYSTVASLDPSATPRLRETYNLVPQIPRDQSALETLLNGG